MCVTLSLSFNLYSQEKNTVFNLKTVSIRKQELVNGKWTDWTKRVPLETEIQVNLEYRTITMDRSNPSVFKIRDYEQDNTEEKLHILFRCIGEKGKEFSFNWIMKSHAEFNTILIRVDNTLYEYEAKVINP